jgi:hypothetical protein
MASRRVVLLIEFQDREVMPSVVAMASFEVSQDPSEPTTNGMVVVSGEYFRNCRSVGIQELHGEEEDQAWSDGRAPNRRN